MHDNLEMSSYYWPKQQIEWHKWGDNGRVWMGEHRHPAASVWVPERQLMKMNYAVESDPPLLQGLVPVVREGYFGEMGQDFVTEAECENDRAKGQPNSFAFELSGVSYPIPTQGSG